MLTPARKVNGSMRAWLHPGTAAVLSGLAFSCARQEVPRGELAGPDEVERNAPARPAQHRERSLPSAPQSSLTLVTDRSLVCMVNNQFMGMPQIPVEVQGRTYYGCCEMCKGRLANEPAARSSLDPVSGNPVDKATAVVARDERGRTFYFENSETFARYVQDAAR